MQWEIIRGGKFMYTIEKYEASIAVSEYVENYVDVPTFLEACKACPNYDKVWSCPAYDFDVIAYWKRYQTLRLRVSKIVFDEVARAKTYTQEELNTFLEEVRLTEKEKLSQQLLELEKEIPGSISLSAGSCHRCKNGCSKQNGEPCRFPEKMRYSIESLGGNVGLTIEKLMGIKLEWMEEGRLPHHFVLVCGLLVP